MWDLTGRGYIAVIGVDGKSRAAQDHIRGLDVFYRELYRENFDPLLAPDEILQAGAVGRWNS